MYLKYKIKVNIITLLDFPVYLQQIDYKRYGDNFEFYENSFLDVEWDLVVVYEGIREIRSIKFKKNGLLFISGEPPFSRCYPKQFLLQFNHLITQHPRIRLHINELYQPALNWHFGLNFSTNKYERFSFEDIKSLTMPIKNKNISVITSSASCFPGHKKRLIFLHKLMERYEGKIDFYGKGINPIPDKADAILPYKFHICLENDTIDDYWTEKFADPVLGYSIPIYSGCTNIDKYFPNNFFFRINIDDIDKTFILIDSILEDPNYYYKEKIEKLYDARYLILNKYNLFPVLENYITRFGINNEVTSINIRPASSFPIFFWLNKKLSLKRFIYRNYYTLISYLKG